MIELFFLCYSALKCWCIPFSTSWGENVSLSALLFLPPFLSLPEGKEGKRRGSPSPSLPGLCNWMETHLGGRRWKQSRWPMNNPESTVVFILGVFWWEYKNVLDSGGQENKKTLFLLKKKKKKAFFIHNLTAHGVKLITFVKHFIFW